MGITSRLLASDGCENGGFFQIFESKAGIIKSKLLVRLVVDGFAIQNKECSLGMYSLSAHRGPCDSKENIIPVLTESRFLVLLTLIDA